MKNEQLNENQPLREAAVSSSYNSTESYKATRRQLAKISTENAKNILKAGDKLRVTKCPGTKRTITFSHFDGIWIVSKSGIDDFHSINVDRLNGLPVDFSK